MCKKVFEELFFVESVEHGGQARIACISASKDTQQMFVRVHSWDEKRQHLDFLEFEGKEVRVTVETVENSVDDFENKVYDVRACKS